MSRPGSSGVMWQRRTNLGWFLLSWKPFAGLDFENAPSFDCFRQSLCEARFTQVKKGGSVYLYIASLGHRSGYIHLLALQQSRRNKLYLSFPSKLPFSAFIFVPPLRLLQHCLQVGGSMKHFEFQLSCGYRAAISCCWLKVFVPSCCMPGRCSQHYGEEGEWKNF